MSYHIKFSNQFKKDVKRCRKRGYDLELLNKAMELLRKDGKLPAKYKTYPLAGNYHGRLECHLKPDWLLIWKQDDKNKVGSTLNCVGHGLVLNYRPQRGQILITTGETRG